MCDLMLPVAVAACVGPLRHVWHTQGGLDTKDPLEVLPRMRKLWTVAGAVFPIKRGCNIIAKEKRPKYARCESKDDGHALLRLEFTL